MTKLVYFIWAILPASLFIIAVRAKWRRLVKAEGREYPLEYLKQAIYCTVGLALAVYVDQVWFEDIVAYFGYQELDLRVIGWLIYPGILTAGGTVQNLFFRKREDERLQAQRERQRDFIAGKQR